jgi:hypothetical protein
MLVIVIVGDGNDNGAGAGGSLDGAQGNAAPHGGPEGDFPASTADGDDDGLSHGQIHGSADGVVAGGVTYDHGDARMCSQNLLRRLVIDDEIAARADVIDDPLLLLAPVNRQARRPIRR